MPSRADPGRNSLPDRCLIRHLRDQPMTTPARRQPPEVIHGSGRSAMMTLAPARQINTW